MRSFRQEGLQAESTIQRNRGVKALLCSQLRKHGGKESKLIVGCEEFLATAPASGCIFLMAVEMIC